MKLHFSDHMVFQNQLGIFLALVLESQLAPEQELVVW